MSTTLMEVQDDNEDCHNIDGSPGQHLLSTDDNLIESRMSTIMIKTEDNNDCPLH